MTAIAVGDVIKSTVIIGDNNRVYKLENVDAGATVNVFEPGTQPRFHPRSAPVAQLPKPFPVLLDREKELGLLRTSVQSSISVSLWAHAGMGKTSLARNLSHALHKEDAGRSIVYLDALGRGRDDLLQALFDLFFESDAAYIPNPASIPAALQKLDALVFLDHLALSSDDVGFLLNAAPGCTFILISTERTLWGEGEIIRLQGLPQPDAVALFEKELGRSLSDPEKELCRQACIILKGCPAEILANAARARECDLPLDALLRELQAQPVSDACLASLATAQLGEADRKILSLLAAAGDNPVPLEFLKNILKDVDVPAALQRLHVLYLVQSHSPRYSLAGSLSSSLSAAWDLAPWQDALLDYSIDWLAQQSASQVVEESLGMFLKQLRDAAERKDWQRVLRLARLLEKFLVYYKRWQAWSDVLDLILQAARALLDRSTEGWALHQLGSRALCQNAFAEAREYLTQALDIRQSLGDRAALAATRHNLDVLNGLIPPPQSGKPPRGDGGSGGGTPPGADTLAARKPQPPARSHKGWLVGCGLAVFAALAILAIIIIALGNPGGGQPAVPDTPYPYRPNPTVPPSPTKPPPQPIPPTEWTEPPPPQPVPPTDTPTPVLLYDFIRNAGGAAWNEYSYDKPISLDFYPEPQYPNPEDYFRNDYNGSGYVGWQEGAQIMGPGSSPERVLLTYPFLDRITGDFSVEVPPDLETAYLEVGGGYKDTYVNSPRGLIFRIYVNGELMGEQTIRVDGTPSFYFPNEPVAVQPGTNVFRLKVQTEGSEPGQNHDPWAVWTIARLWGRPSMPAPSGGNPPPANSSGDPLGPAQAAIVRKANCRTGPSTSHDTVTSFEPGQVVQIFGRNPDHNNTWWYVLIPGTQDHCWISIITAQATGDFDAIPDIGP